MGQQKSCVSASVTFEGKIHPNDEDRILIHHYHHILGITVLKYGNLEQCKQKYDLRRYKYKQLISETYLVMSMIVSYSYKVLLAMYD